MKNITIKDDTHKKLKKIAEKESLTMSSFLDSAVSYFDKTKVSPQTDIISIKEEMKKLEKRVNQVIAFIRQFENENLIPLVKEMKKDRDTATLTYQNINDKINDDDINKIGIKINEIHNTFKIINKDKEDIIKKLRERLTDVKNNLAVIDENEEIRHQEILEVILNKDKRAAIAEKYKIEIKKAFF
jgi:predicted transcriptional regulator